MIWGNATGHAGIRRLLDCVIALTALLLTTMSSAAMPPHAKEITRHLELLGYRVTKVDGSLLVKTGNISFAVSGVNNGALLLAVFPTYAQTKVRRASLVEIVNDMDSDSIETTFWVDGVGHLRASTWYVGDYERIRFGEVVTQYLTDIKSELKSHASKILPFFSKASSRKH